MKKYTRFGLMIGDLNTAGEGSSTGNKKCTQTTSSVPDEEQQYHQRVILSKAHPSRFTKEELQKLKNEELQYLAKTRKIHPPLPGIYPRESPLVLETFINPVTVSTWHPHDRRHPILEPHGRHFEGDEDNFKSHFRCNRIPKPHDVVGQGSGQKLVESTLRVVTADHIAHLVKENARINQEFERRRVHLNAVKDQASMGFQQWVDAVRERQSANHLAYLKQNGMLDEHLYMLKYITYVPIFPYVPHTQSVVNKPVPKDGKIVYLKSILVKNWDGSREGDQKTGVVNPTSHYSYGFGRWKLGRSIKKLKRVRWLWCYIVKPFGKQDVKLETWSVLVPISESIRSWETTGTRITARDKYLHTSRSN